MEDKLVKRGNLKYKYIIHIDLENVVDAVMDILRGYYDEYDFGISGDDLQIEAKDTQRYIHYHSPATILDPPEDETVVDTIKNVDINKVVLTALHDLDKVKTDVEIVSEEYEEDE